MKKILLWMGIFLVLISSVSADYFEDFEDTLGSEWIVEDAIAQRSTTQAYNGSYSLELSTTGDGGDSDNAIMRLNMSATGNPTPENVSFWYRDDWDDRFYFQVMDTVANSYMYLFLRNNGLEYYDGSTWQTCGDFDVGWNFIELRDIDYDANTYDVYLNGTRCVDDNSFRQFANPLPPNHLEFFAYTSDNDETYVDNVKLDSLSCSLDNLDYCTTQELCEGVNGTFYNNTCYDFRSNLEYYLTFDDEYISGVDDATDSYSNITFTNNGADVSQTGLLDESYYFDGSDSVIKTGSLNRDNFTISLWFNTDTTTQNAHIISNWDLVGGLENKLALGLTSDGYVRFELEDDYDTTTTTYDDGTWHFLTLTTTSTQAIGYIDGVNIINLTYDGSFDATNYLMEIGARKNGYDLEFTGDVDDTAFWNKTLSSKEISVLYNNGDGLNPLTYNASECSLDNLDACDTQSACEGVDGTFYNGTCYDMKSNLQQYYSFDIDTREDINLIKNMTIYDSPTKISGKVGDGAYSFDGTNDYMQFESFDSGKTTYSLSFWFKGDDLSSRQRFFHSDEGNSGYLFSLRYDSGTGLVGYSGGSSGQYYQTTSSATLTQDTWQHIVYVYEDNINPTIYIDGVNQSGATASGGSGYGAWYNTTFLAHVSTEYTQGDIDEISIFDDALSQEEVAVLYNNGVGLNPLTYSATAPTNNAPTYDTISPADNSTGQSITTDLSLKVYDDDLDNMTVKFYVNDVLNCTNTDVVNGSTTTCDLGTLSYSTTYEWYVTINDSTDVTTTGTYNFTTIIDNPANISLYSPLDGATNQSLNTDLMVNATDDFSNLDIEFYLGGVLQCNETNVTSGVWTTCDIGLLDYATQYNWSVVVNETDGSQGIVEEYSFTTEFSNASVVELLAPPNETIEVLLATNLTANITDVDSTDMNVTFYRKNEYEIYQDVENWTNYGRGSDTVYWDEDFGTAVSYPWLGPGAGDRTYSVNMDTEYVIPEPKPDLILWGMKHSGCYSYTPSIQCWNHDTSSFIGMSNIGADGQYTMRAWVPQNCIPDVGESLKTRVVGGSQNCDSVQVAHYYEEDVTFYTYDDVIYSTISNSSEITYEYTDLLYSTTYDWYVNSTDESQSYMSEVWTFETIAQPSYRNEMPTDSSTDVPIESDIAIIVETLNNESNYPLNVTLHFNNSEIYNDIVASGTNVTTAISTFNYNTTYDWYVNIYDGFSNVTTPVYNFTTVRNYAPTYQQEYPGDGTEDLSIINNTLSINVSDVEDNIDVKFYFNNTLYCTYDNTVSDTNLSCVVDDEILLYNTTYDWYVTLNDTYNFVTTPTYQFTTIRNFAPTYDTYGPDGSVNTSITPTLYTKIYDVEDNVTIKFYANNTLQCTNENVSTNSNTTCVVVSSLDYNQQYEWYFTLNDTYNFVTSDTYNFTTLSNQPPIYNNEYPENNTQTVEINNSYLGITVEDPDEGLMTVTFNFNGSVLCVNSNVENGTQTNCSLPYLPYNTTYTWNITVDDTVFEVDSPNYIFKTKLPNQPPEITITSPTSGKAAVDEEYTVEWTTYDQENDTLGNMSCYADDNNVGYNKTYSCFYNSLNDGNESCDTSSWDIGNYYIWCEIDDEEDTGRAYSNGQLVKGKVVADIEPTAPANTVPLYGWCNGTDPDGDSLRYTYSWYKNGRLFDSGVSEYYPSGSNINVDFVNATNTTNAEVWEFHCQAEDSGDGLTYPEDYATVQISNYAPTEGIAQIIPNANVTTSHDLTGWCNGTDDDGDNVSFEYRWYRGGTLYSSGGLFSTQSLQNIKAGYQFSCGLTNDDALRCTGDNTYGQIGDGTTTQRLNPTDVDVSGFSTYNLWSDYDVGYFHVCGVHFNENLYCWGRNNEGQLGFTGTQQSEPIQVDLSNVEKVYTGYQHTCAINTTGSVYCWGHNVNGQLGIGTNIDTSIPTLINISTTFTKLSLGEQHTCGLATDGKVYCWGLNEEGQLGTGDTTTYYNPTEINPLTINNYTDISVGLEHSCAVHSNENLYCWGSQGGEGVLGTGEQFGNYYTPNEINSTESYDSLDAGQQHTCAITTTGELYCWGYGFNGRLGTGFVFSEHTPTQVGTAFTDISAGYQHTCGINSSGSYCWGRGEFGRMGMGDEISYYTPTIVQNLQRQYLAQSTLHNINNMSSVNTSNGESWYMQCKIIDPFGAESDWITSNTVEISNEAPSTPIILTPLTGFYDGRPGYDGTVDYDGSDPINYVDVSCGGSIDLEFDNICYQIQYNYGSGWNNLVTCDNDGNYTWDIRSLGDKASVDLQCRAYDGYDYSDWYNPSGTLEFDSSIPSISHDVSFTNDKKYNTSINFTATVGVGERYPGSGYFRWYNGTDWSDKNWFNYTAGENYSFYYPNQLIGKLKVIKYDWWVNDSIGHKNGVYSVNNGVKSYSYGCTGRSAYPVDYIRDTQPEPITNLIIDVTDVGVGERFCGIASGGSDVDCNTSDYNSYECDDVDSTYLYKITNVNTSEVVLDWTNTNGWTNGRCFVVRDEDAHDTFEIEARRVSRATGTPTCTWYGLRYTTSSPNTILSTTIEVNNTRPNVTAILPQNIAYKFETFNFSFFVDDDEGLDDIEYCELYTKNDTSSYSVYHNFTSVTTNNNSIEYPVSLSHQENVQWYVECNDGRITDSSEVREVRIDNTAPVISIDAPSPDNTTIEDMYDGIINIDATASGGNINYTYLELTYPNGSIIFNETINAGGASSQIMDVEISYDTYNLTNGTYHINYYVEDLTIGNFSTSNSFYANMYPNVSNVSIVPPSATEPSDLFCNGTYYDLEDDVESSTWTWWVLENGSRVLLNSTSQTLYKEYTNTNSTYICRYNVNDGTQNGDFVESEEMYIGNAPPYFSVIPVDQSTQTGSEFNYAIYCLDNNNDDVVTFGLESNETTVVTINSTSGVLSGTFVESDIFDDVNEDVTAVYLMNVSCTDGQATTYANFNLNVTDATPPTISNKIFDTNECKIHNLFNFSLTIDDGIGLDSYRYRLYETDEWSSYQSFSDNTTSYNYSHQYNNTLRQGKTATYRFWYNDISNNFGYTESSCVINNTGFTTNPIVTSDLGLSINTLTPTITYTQGIEPDGNPITNDIYIGHWNGTDCVNETIEYGNQTLTSLILGQEGNGWHNTYNESLQQGTEYCTYVVSKEQMFDGDSVIDTYYYSNESNIDIFKIATSYVYNSIELTPDPAYSTSFLTCNVSGYHPDDEIIPTFTYIWNNGSVDTKVENGFFSTYNCSLNGCYKGQVISCNAINSTDSVNVDAVTNITISNTKTGDDPTNPNASLPDLDGDGEDDFFARTVPSPVAVQSQNIKGYCYGEDLDGDDLRYWWYWYDQTGLRSFGRTSAYYPQGTEVLVDTLSASYTELGDEWTFYCKADDGESTSANYSAVPVTINSEPVITNVEVFNERDRNGEYGNGEGFNGALVGETIEFRVSGNDADNDYMTLIACNESVSSFDNCSRDDILCTSTIPSQWGNATPGIVSCYYDIPAGTSDGANEFYVAVQDDYGLYDTDGPYNFYVYSPTQPENQTATLIDLEDDKQRWQYNFSVGHVAHLGIEFCGADVDGTEYLTGSVIGNNCTIEWEFPLNESIQTMRPVILTTGNVRHYLENQSTFSTDVSIEANDNATSNLTVQNVYKSNNVRSYTYGTFNNIHWTNSNGVDEYINISGGEVVNSLTNHTLDLFTVEPYYVIDDSPYVMDGAYQVAFNFTYNWTEQSTYGKLPAIPIEYNPQYYYASSNTGLIDGATLDVSDTRPMRFTMPEVNGNAELNGTLKHYSEVVYWDYINTNYSVNSSYRYYNTDARVKFYYDIDVTNDTGIFVHIDYESIPYYRHRLNLTGNDTFKEVKNNFGNVVSADFTDNDASERLEINWAGDTDDIYYDVELNWTYYDEIFECNDGIDNDGDGNIDSTDSGCWIDRTDNTTYSPSINDESWCGDGYKDAGEQCDGGADCTELCVFDVGGEKSGGGPSGPPDPVEVTNESRFIRLEPNHITADVTRGSVSIEEFQIRNIMGEETSVEIKFNTEQSHPKSFGWIYFKDARNENVNEFNNFILPEVTTVDSQLRYVTSFIDIPNNVEVGKYRVVYDIIDIDDRVTKLVYDIDVNQGFLENLREMEETTFVIGGLVATALAIGGTAIWLL